MFSLQRLFFLFGLVWLSTQAHAQVITFQQSNFFQGCNSNPCADWIVVGGSDASITAVPGQGYSPLGGSFSGEPCAKARINSDNPNVEVISQVPFGVSPGPGGTIATSFHFNYSEFGTGTPVYDIQQPWVAPASIEWGWGTSPSGPWTNLREGSLVVGPYSDIWNVNNAPTTFPPAGVPLYWRFAFNYLDNDDWPDVWAIVRINSIQITSAPACSGVPNPGNTTGPVSASCWQPITLGLQNSLNVTDISHQWFRSSTSSEGPWTPVGNDEPTYETTIYNQTWFYCEVTCNAPGGETGNSSVIQVEFDSSGCDDGNPCTEDFCDPVLGCTHTPLPDTDGDGICDAEDSCPSVPGEIGDPCDDGIACTENDVIDADCECHGTPNHSFCDDGNICTDDICDPLLGCVFINNSAPCDDGNACTDGDFCSGGACVGGPPLVCDDGNPCTIVSCNPATGCVYINLSGACDDGDACTVNDQCIDGTCVGTPIDCDDGNACTVDFCDPVLGCQYVPIVCDDGDPCTIDTCDPELGCIYINICGPDNNQCQDAEILSIPTWPQNSNTLGTLFEAGDNGAAFCSGATGGDVYYSFTATSLNHYFITVNPFGGFDAVVQVLDACSGTELACINSSGAGGVETELLQELPAGDYVVRVQNLSGSIATVEDGNFLVGVQSFPQAKVQDNPNNFLYACNTTDRQLEDIVGAMPQSGQQPGIMDYRWKVVQQGGGLDWEWTRGAPNYATILNWLLMDYNAIYDVSVKMLINIPGVGPTWGVYGEVCTIATSSTVTTTQVRIEYSPNNIQGNAYAMCDIAVAETVADAVNYRWTFSVIGDPDVEYERGVGNPSVKLSWVDCLKPNTTYNVTVQANVGGVWGPIGEVRQIDFAPTANTQLRSNLCGGTWPINKWMLPTGVCTSDSHQWRLVNVNDISKPPQEHIINTTNGSGAARLSWAVPALVPGESYFISVFASQCGVGGDYSGVCTITVQGPEAPIDETPAARSLSETTASLFPNPNAGTEVRVELSGLGDGNHEVMIQIYDIYGKLVQTEGFGHAGSDMSRLVRFDGNLAMGMYMVQIVVDGERFATERLVIK